MIFNEEHIEDLCNEMLANPRLSEDNMSHLDGLTRLQVLLDMKDITCVWAIYLRLAIKNENYELATKIRECIKIEKQTALQILDYLQEDVYEEDIEILDQIVEEIIEIIQ
jgi:hypothetical protein